MPSFGYTHPMLWFFARERKRDSMRKTVCVLLLLAVVSLLFVTSAAEEADETSVYLEKTSVEMTVGGYGWLRSGLQNRKPGVKMTSLTWESTDEQVVTIDDESKYVAVGRGQAQLIRRIKTNDGKEYVGVCDVRVVIPVEEVVCDVQSLVLIAGKEAPLPDVRVLPEEADVRTCTWTSSHPEIVSVENGRIAAHAAGKAVLTVTSDERIEKRRLRTASVQVTVIPAVESLKVNGADQVFRLEAGVRSALSLEVLPQGTTMEALHFESSDEQIVTVGTDGVMLGHAAGKAVITVWTDQTASGEKLQASLEVEVYRKIERISLSPNPYVAFRGQTVTLTPVITPADADISGLSVSWTSDNPYVAGVYGISLSAEVECRQVGQSKITVRAEDGSRKRGSVHFRVEPTVPVTIRNAKAEKQGDNMSLALELKNRMRETAVREVSFHLDIKDGEGALLSSRTASLAVHIPPARRGFYTLPLNAEEIPEAAVTVEIRIVEIAYPRGEYAIPEELQSVLEIPLKQETSDQ